MLRGLSTNTNCHKIIRMSVDAFKILCQKLENQCGLRPTQRMSVEEQVARFLHIVGNDFRTRFVSWLYRRFVSFTSRHFHKVLNAIISLEDQYIKQATGNIVQKEIQDKPRFYPFFKDCIRAIDGTHVRVRVPNRDAPRYCSRKGYPKINVLVACTFDLKFTYVLSGWEGTVSDSGIIKDALTRDDKLLILDGKYYLVDGGLPHINTLIAPYRGVRYHLKEYSSHAPQNPQELFNLRHSSLRNSIERAFGVLKKRFSIIRSTQEPFYSCDTHVDIFLAYSILHNFLLEVDHDKELKDEVIHEMLDASHDEERKGPRDTDDRGEQIRISIANDMWSDYMLHPNNEINMSN
ncbi:putative nuclease HARBI1 [Tanacetum coccineum]